MFFIVCLLFFRLFLFVTTVPILSYVVTSSSSLEQQPIDYYLTNTEKVGFLLYSEFGLVVVLWGVILLLAIIGCVLILKNYYY